MQAHDHHTSRRDAVGALRRNAGRRAQRGAASIEAAMGATFFVLLFWGVIFVGRRHEAYANTQITARGCAWTIASAGCNEVPVECRGSGTQKLPANQSQKQKFEPVEDEAFRSDSRQFGGELHEALGAQIDGLLFTRVSATSARDVERPALFGGESISVSSLYTLPCNSRPSGIKDQLKAVWETVKNL